MFDLLELFVSAIPIFQFILHALRLKKYSPCVTPQLASRSFTEGWYPAIQKHTGFAAEYAG